MTHRGKRGFERALSENKGRSRTRKVLLIFVVFFVSILIGAAVGTLSGYIGDVPTLDQVVFDQKLTTTIYDIHERPIARLFTENRVPVRLRDVPDILIQAFLAAEDRNFFNHHGFDLRGIARAAISLVRTGEITEGGGGSTITQQLAKLSFLTHDRTWKRKINELFWSIQIERKFTKNEILETYFNTVYYGHGTYGVQSAAQLFFGKSIEEIDLPEAALLAGVINGPAYFSPYLSMEGATRRRDVILHRMLDFEYIDQSEYDKAKATPISVIGLKEAETRAPYFVRRINTKLQRDIGLDASLVYGGGLNVYTTLDLDIQEAAERALEQWDDRVRVDHRGQTQPQAAIVTLDVNNGHIRAWVGGRGDPGDPYDRVLNERRPGSAYKPFVYAAAIESLDYTPATMRIDELKTYQLVNGSTYTPQNNDGVYLGNISLRLALEKSINTVATQLIDEIGPREAVKYAKKLGITSLVETGRVNDLTLSSALGGLTRGVSPLEMASAYGVFASGGILSEPIDILKVVAPNGTVIYEAPPPKQKLVLSPETSYLMTDMMRGVIEKGTGTAANIGVPAAGKTGTSDDYVDGWFVGYTRDLVTALWIGEDDGSSMEYPSGRIIGSGTAARLWRSVMQEAIADRPIRDFTRPDGIVGPITIDVTNGKLISDKCEAVPDNEKVPEIFTRQTEPKDVSERCSPLFSPPRGLLRWLP